jgi:hypothetical protein
VLGTNETNYSAGHPLTQPTLEISNPKHEVAVFQTCIVSLSCPCSPGPILNNFPPEEHHFVLDRGGESKAIFPDGATIPKQKKRKRGAKKTSKQADDAPSDGSPEDNEECPPGEESTPEAAGTSEGSDEGGLKVKHGKGMKVREWLDLPP